MKPLVCVLIFLVLTTPTQAQLWRYLNDNPQGEAAAERALDKEACSIVTKHEIFFEENISYKLRTYCLRAFDSIGGKIGISPGERGHAILIAGPKDSIKLDDVSRLVKVHFFRPELLEVVYSPRGGSDQGFEYVLILGLNKGHIQVAAEFLTINEYSMPNEHHLRELRLKPRGNTLQDYNLTVGIRDLTKSTADSTAGHDRRSIVDLKFDEARMIFYNKIEHNYPTIDLGDNEKYYYFDNSWHQLVKDETGEKSAMSAVH